MSRPCLSFASRDHQLSQVAPSRSKNASSRDTAALPSRTTSIPAARGLRSMYAQTAGRDSSWRITTHSDRHSRLCLRRAPESSPWQVRRCGDPIGPLHLPAGLWPPPLSKGVPEMTDPSDELGRAIRHFGRVQATRGRGPRAEAAKRGTTYESLVAAADSADSGKMGSHAEDRIQLTWSAPAPSSQDSAARLSFVACVSDEEVLRTNLLASPCLGTGSGHEVILVKNCPSAADGLNLGLARSSGEWVIALHQDVFLPDGWDRRLALQLREAERRFGPVGVAGVYGVGPARELSVSLAAERIGRVLDRGRLLCDGPGLPARLPRSTSCF